MDKRPESRVLADIPVRIWGMDASGKPFFGTAIASNLSAAGAQLSHIRHTLKVGDTIGIQYENIKARFEVKWAKTSVAPGRDEAGVRILANQPVPWGEVTAAVIAGKPAPPKLSHAADKRRFARHKVQFPLTVSFPDGQRAHMQCTATDMSGRGCYIESLVPLPLTTVVIITFWIDSDKIRTNGVVRASDPGVGMGIEFTTLEDQIQKRLQAYLEKIDQGFASAAGQSS
jgi:PilZ domain